MMRQWRVARGGLEPIETQDALREVLLSQRGLSADNFESFFAPTYERDIHDPMSLCDMDIAVDRLWHAIKKKERIVIYGDYDVDGVTSTAVLVLALEALGAHVSPYIPHREDDGYGLNQKVLERLLPEMDLLITVDCGISGAEEIAWLGKQGVETIVIDHHTIPEVLPPAKAIIHAAHPKGQYKWPSLCGAGVAWKTACALVRDKRSPFYGDPDYEKWLLDLVALGTVADVVPMLGENRAIVKFGLEVLRRSKRVGITTLIDSLKLNRSTLSAEDLSFQIIPRLNAAGRMEHAQPALDLLLATNEHRAKTLLANINVLNNRRQTVTRRIMQEVEAQIPSTSPGFVFAYSHDWPAGVVGLAANRLAEKFSCPAVVIGGNGAQAVGSARSPLNVNVLEFLRGGEEHLVRLGGHAQAAGFTLTVEAIENFRSALGSGVPVAQPTVIAEYADAVLANHLLSRRTIRALEDFAPYGERNKRPRFIIKDLPLADARVIGKQADHGKFTFIVDDEPLDGIGFGLASAVKELGRHKRVAVLGELEENEFRGQRRLQINVRDIAPPDTITLTEDL